jgi:hypothetical protein
MFVFDNMFIWVSKTIKYTLCDIVRFSESYFQGPDLGTTNAEISGISNQRFLRKTRVFFTQLLIYFFLKLNYSYEVLAKLLLTWKTTFSQNLSLLFLNIAVPEAMPGLKLQMVWCNRPSVQWREKIHANVAKFQNNCNLQSTRKSNIFLMKMYKTKKGGCRISVFFT